MIYLVTSELYATFVDITGDLATKIWGYGIMYESTYDAD